MGHSSAQQALGRGLTMSRAVVSRAVWTRLLSTFLVLAFALSVTLVAYSSSVGGPDISSASAKSNRDGRDSDDARKHGDDEQTKRSGDKSREADREHEDDREDDEKNKDGRPKSPPSANATRPAEPPAAQPTQETGTNGKTQPAPADPELDAPASSPAGELGESGESDEREDDLKPADSPSGEVVVGGCESPTPKPTPPRIVEVPALSPGDCGDPTVVTIWAGQHHDVGTVTVSRSGSNLYLDYRTKDGWAMTETHADVGVSDPGGSPGQLTYKSAHNPAVTFKRYVIPIDPAWTPGTELYVRAHAVVVHPDMPEETGWAGAWKSFFRYTLPTCPGKISGYKFEDVNGDGHWDTRTEPGLPGWTIQLFTKNAGEWVLKASTQTGAGGRYEFTGLKPGSYKVEEVQQSGWAKTFGGREFEIDETGSLVVSRYACRSAFDFGNRRLATYRKTFSLTAAGLDGRYGSEIDYFVTFMVDGQPAQLDLSESAPHTAAIGDLQSGTSLTNISWWAAVDGEQFLLGTDSGPEVIADKDLLNTLDYRSRVRGYKFQDADGDGEWAIEGESALPGWVIELYAMGDSEPMATTVTDEFGHYAFEGLLPGEYYVLEVQEEGFTQTSGPTDAGSYFSIANGVDRRQDFGNKPDTFTKSWELFVSADGAALEGVEYGVSFTLDGEELEETLAREGTEDGYAKFVAETEVDFGQIIDDVVWWATWKGERIEIDSSDLKESVSGDLANTSILDGRLFGSKYHDDDRDGVWGDEEPGLSGWTVRLYRRMVSGAFGLIAQTTTVEGGAYAFAGLVPGEYYVAEVQQDGWEQITGSTGPDDSFSFSGNEEVGSLDFGNDTTKYVKTWRLFGPGLWQADAFHVTYRLNGEQMRADLRSLAIADDWDVDGRLNSTFFAEEDTVVEAGDVITRVEWFATYDGEEIKLGDGAAREVVDGDLTNTFSFDARAFGSKWDDSGPIEDGGQDGLWGAGEPGIAGWTIRLFRRAANGGWKPYDVTTTESDGSYVFKGLLPGAYYLAEDIPPPATPEEPLWIQSAGPTEVGEGVFVVANGTFHGPVDFGNYVSAPFDLGFDLAIEKTAVTEASPGQIVTYTLTYTNVGDETARDFTVVDTFDPEWVEVYEVFDAEVATPILTWELAGPLAPGESGQIEYKMLFSKDFPEGTTFVDNDVEIEHPKDEYEPNDRDVHRVRVTTGLPFLPFTGDTGLAVLAALAAAGIGVALRRSVGSPS